MLNQVFYSFAYSPQRKNEDFGVDYEELEFYEIYFCDIPYFQYFR